MSTRERNEYGKKLQEKLIAIEKRQMAGGDGGGGAGAGGGGAGAGGGGAGVGSDGAGAVSGGAGVGACRPLGAQIRVLTLNHGEHQDSNIFRLEKGSYLQFCPGPSLLGRKVFVYTNYVISNNKGAEFVRNQYHALEWRRGADAGAGAAALEAGAMVHDTDMHCELRLARAGSFHYYFLYENGDSTIGPQGSGFFQVAPTLRLGAGGEELPLDCVASQTVLAKSLGALPTWEAKMRVAKETGYNMIHFTPIQELGASNSSYSIADQLAVNPLFSDTGHRATFADIESLVDKMRNEWKVLSICDIVLNHTANESQWLAEHPEATYNAASCPHLRPAALLDGVLSRLTDAVARGDYEHRGVPARVTTNQHLDAIKHLLATELVPAARIHELFVCDVNDIVQEFYSLARHKVPPVNSESAEDKSELKIIQDPQYRRLKSTVDMEQALHQFNIYRADCYDEDTRLKRCTEELKRRLEELNQEAYDDVQRHLASAIDNCIAGMRYFRVQSDGPKVEEVSIANPLVPRYFTQAETGGGGEAAEAAAEAALYDERGRFVMAHNGWVMNADPLVDFAAGGGGARGVYLRRELIAWGDSVKLRYGDKPEDVPFLWQHMREYVELTARIFDGIRLDNCHSTPLHVAEYLLDCARRVRPELYVVAELFTNSDQLDNIFVNRLGITSLIREAQSAWDSHELGRLVYRYGGRPVGAFLPQPRRAAVPAIAHAIFLDVTHDNPSPVDKRSVFDLLPSAALVSMACCASGSTRGYDELVPHHIHVVDEKRQYAEWGGEGAGAAEGGRVLVDSRTGIVAAKRALNQLHYELGYKGYDQVYVDQMDQDIVAVTRHEPSSRQTVILVAFTAFSQPDLNQGQRSMKPLKFEGKLEEILLEASLRHVDHRAKVPPFAKHGAYINGLSGYEACVKQNLPLSESSVFAGAARRDGRHTLLDFKNFRPGSVVAVRVSMWDEARAALERLHRFVEAPELPLALDLADLNVALYQCDAEERDNGGSGVYDVPGSGPLVYAGLQGVLSLLAEVRPSDDLGHPLCANLRDGDWMIDYQWRRLARRPSLEPLSRWLEASLAPIKQLPRYLVPAYFDAVVTRAHALLVSAASAQMSPFVRDGSSLERALALAGVQCGAAARSVALPAPSPRLAPPPPRSPPLTLSAGLPHFCTGYMRCWGRDTFISLRGLFLLTGRYQDARVHILAFGACLRHGLIPNLLDGGPSARFNCRDAVWWWLQSIKEYCAEAPHGYELLQDVVSRVFPTDDAPPAPPGRHDQPLHDVMQEALDKHFQGLVFRERNAGRTIDAHMSDKGFNNQIGVNPETGFVFGGNEANCGTWMDKMGSSEAAGTRGRPATPRDGSAVELVGLAKSVVTWLAAAHRDGRYPYPGVRRQHRDGSLTTWSYAQWADTIQRNFERYFWVHTSPAATDLRPDLVHRRGIYKDSHGASQPWADYQLRCNFPIAMALAPELFDARHAWSALDAVRDHLLGPLGVKTLDPDDWAYCGVYDNSNQSADPKVAHGFNYHQGPEWVWPIGFYLRARLAFAQQNGCLGRTVGEVRAALAAHAAELHASPWRGLPELTDAGGAFCAGSCRTQAWSAATVLEVLHELRRIEGKRPLQPSDN